MLSQTGLSTLVSYLPIYQNVPLGEGVRERACGYPTATKSQDKHRICLFEKLNLHVHRVPQDFGHRVVCFRIERSIGHIHCESRHVNYYYKILHYLANEWTLLSWNTLTFITTLCKASSIGQPQDYINGSHSRNWQRGIL